MKKLICALLSVMMCLSLVACGGPDKQPAIDAHNRAKEVFNEVSAFVNDNPGAFDEALVDQMISIANTLNEYSQALSSSETIEEEKLNAMIEWYNGVEEWANQVKEVIESSME